MNKIHSTNKIINFIFKPGKIMSLKYGLIYLNIYFKYYGNIISIIT